MTPVSRPHETPGLMIAARPVRPLRLLQARQRVDTPAGSVVRLTPEQVAAGHLEAAGVFEYQCPSCRAWVSRLHDVGGRLRCPWCVDWRPLVGAGPHAGAKERSGPP